ncbi:hypothetical protein D3C79_504470 [compost metagenome]
MGRQVGERQLLTVHDALAGEGDIGVHRPPTLGAEFFDRQHLARRLFAGAAPGLLGGVRVCANQRREVLEQQLVGHQVARQLWPRLTGDESQVTVDVAGADLAVEAPVVERRAFGRMQVGREVAVGGIRWRVRQRHARQRIEIAQAGTGQAQAHVQGTEVTRIGQGAGKHRVGVGDAHVGLQRERLTGILQRQQAADLAGARHRLALVAALGLEAEGIVLGAACLLGAGLADDVAERDRLAQWVDLHLHAGFQRLVIEADVALVETDGTDLQLPAGGGLVFILGAEVERPVGATVGQAGEACGGFAQVDARNDDLLEHQRQRRQAKLHALQTDHPGLLEPVGVAQGQVFGDEVRPRHPRAPAAFLGLGAPLHGQVAVDCKGPVQGCGNLLVEQRLDAVPVKGGDHHHQDCQQGQKGGEGPDKDSGGTRHCVILLTTWHKTGTTMALSYSD